MSLFVLCPSLSRLAVKFEYFLNKKHTTNPVRGPYHARAPSMMITRVIRGMIPHKTPRGAAALDRLKVFEGCPNPYDRLKKVVMPEAIRNLRLKPGRKYCRLGDLSHSVGWSHNALIKKLEDKRRVKGAAYHNTKKELVKVTVCGSIFSTWIMKAILCLSLTIPSDCYAFVCLHTHSFHRQRPSSLPRRPSPPSTLHWPSLDINCMLVYNHLHPNLFPVGTLF